MSSMDEIVELLSVKGARQYGSENVSQFQHALQCAALAESEDAPSTLITAALLHDIGHLIDTRFEGAAANGIDRKHEQIGHAYLGKWFGEEVTGPVALHVPAKRYLCAVDPGYFDTLSFGSVRSLNLQGGPFESNDAREFLRLPHAKEAIRLRRWDEAAKDPAAKTDSLDHFLCHVEAAATAHARMTA